MKIKLRDFSTFLNEEADVKKNIGLPDDFTRNAEEDAKRNLGVNVDSGELGRLGEYMNKAASIIVRSIPIEQVENKFQQMENLAKRVIEEEFKTIFQILPLDLKLRLIRPNESVIGQLPELGEKQEEPGSRPEINEEPEETNEVQPEVESDETQSDETQSDEEQDDFFDFFDFDSDEEQQESEEENIEEITEPEVTNKDVAMAIDKTQILNMITQGAGKATKDIIKFSETISKGLEDIIGSNAKELLKVWGQLSDEADKRDWRVPMDVTKNLFKNSPGGIAGAVDVKFENYNLKFKNSELIIESGNASKIIIRAFGVDFPMLLHEAVKGIYMALQSPAIKKNPELAEEIKRATSSYKDETSDFRYGPLAQKMFRDFVNHCNMADRYPNMIERVFFFLSKDVEHGGKFTDEEFLKITKSMFSVFDKVNTEAGKFQFRINEENFQSSEAKTKIEEIIKEEVQFEEELEAEERAEDLKKALPSENEPTKSSEPAGEDEEDEIEKLRRATAERESDYTNMSPREIQELIDDALDSGDYERVKMLSGYLTKESAQIYLRELERINENKIIRR
jgi:hypothetical protein